jgi:CheY-like chemotaxis protein
MAVVLVVEDEAQIRAVLSRVLSKAGHSVRLAANGQEALASMAVQRPDLILLDEQMPVMGGAEFVVRLRELPGSAPPVVLIGSASSGASAQALGAAGVAPKPFDVPRLLKFVGDLAGGS